MSGKIVPSTGDIYLKTAPGSAANAIFEVFGTQAGGKLSGLVGSEYDPQDTTIRFTACNIPALPLSMSTFRGDAKYATSPTIGVTNLTTTTLTPNFSGGGGTTYYVAIGTSAGGSNSQTTPWRVMTNGTGALTLTPSLSTGTSYYISGYASNADKTRTLAVSNTAAFVPVATPSITANTISNTTFTATAAMPTGATSNEYKLYKADNTLQATNTTGIFTGLTSNTQYYVTVQGKTSNTSSGLTTSSTVWCLSRPTLTFFTVGSSALTATIGAISTNATGIVISNVDSGSASSPALATTTTSATFSRGSTTTSNTYTSNTLVTYVVNAVATNTSYSSSNLVFIIVDDTYGANKTVTLTSGTFSYTVAGGRGGNGVDTSGNTYASYGYGGWGYGTTSAVSSGTTLTLCAGKNGPTGSYALYNNASCNYMTPSVKCGDGTKGGNGGRGAAHPYDQNGPGNGGCSGGGGAASQLFGGTFYVIAGGGGGSGGGGGQGGNGGWAGSAGTGIQSGGFGASYYGALTFTSNGTTGYFGGQGGYGDAVFGYGGTSGSNTFGNRSTGTSGFSMNKLAANNTAAYGVGGDGGRYFGTMGAGGGGGYGGGGGGVALNDSQHMASGGGGGGGSFSTDTATAWTDSTTPFVSVVWNS